MSTATSDRRRGLTGDKGMKRAVQAVATSNVTQSGAQTVDGFAATYSNAAGIPDRILCKAQTDATENGIWDVQSGAWTRSLDADTTDDWAQGMTVLVLNGTQAGTYWRCTTADPIVPGTSSIAFTQALTDSIPLMVSADAYGAAGDGVTDDIAVLEAAATVAGIGGVWLTPNKSYRVSRRWATLGVMSDGTGTIVADYADFTNANPAITGRYGDNAVVVDLSGLTVAPFTTADRPFCVGIRIEYTRAGDGRKNVVNAIAARNCTSPRIENCEISGFPVGCCIKASSWVGGSASHNYIHDAYDNNDWSNTFYNFTVSGVTTAPSYAATYTNNGQTFTILSSALSGGAGLITATGTGSPAASGTLTRSAGTGDATISFSAAATVAGGSAYAQLTGIEFDNDRINSVASSRVKIHDNTIDDITCGAASIAANGGVMQSDGINVAHPDTERMSITDNVISNVGEGIDYFGHHGMISGNNISYVDVFGLKLAHGAYDNTISGGTIAHFGLGGIVLSGSDSASDTTDCSYNTINGVSISDGDYLGTFVGNSTYGIGFISGGASTLSVNIRAKYNMVSNCSINMGANLKYGIYDVSDTANGGASGEGGYNNCIGIRIVPGAALVARVYNTTAPNSTVSVCDPTKIAAYQNAAQTITSGGGAQVVQYDTETVDRRNEYSSTAYTATIDVTGLYNISATVRIPAFPINNSMTLKILVNGSAVGSNEFRCGSSGDNSFSVHKYAYKVVQGQTIKFDLTPATTADLALSALAYTSYMSIEAAD